jgi:hypothetical protein
MVNETLQESFNKPKTMKPINKFLYYIVFNYLIASQ